MYTYLSYVFCMNPKMRLRAWCTYPMNKSLVHYATTELCFYLNPTKETFYLRIALNSTLFDPR